MNEKKQKKRVGRSILSFLFNGLFFFVIPSLIFYWLTKAAEFLPELLFQNGANTAHMELPNFYLPEVTIPLPLDLPIPLPFPVLGLRIAITPIIGLLITIIAIISWFVTGTVGTGSKKYRTRGLLGSVKNIIAMVWIWFFYDQISIFKIEQATTSITIIIHWSLYLLTGLIIFGLMAIANLVGSISTKEEELTVKEPSKKKKEEPSDSPEKEQSKI